MEHILSIVVAEVVATVLGALLLAAVRWMSGGRLAV
jgi:hypothetical protein